MGSVYNDRNGYAAKLELVNKLLFCLKVAVQYTLEKFGVYSCTLVSKEEVSKENN